MNDDVHLGSRENWQQTAALAVCLFALLFALYLLTYSGVLHSVDEISRFAVTENLVKNGRYDANSFLAIYFGLWGSLPLEGGIMYSKYGLADSVLPMPLYWLALQLGNVGLVQATILFNALVTPLTAVLILLFLTRLGYRYAVGFLVGLAFGVATIAAVYARYFFSEPLAALTLLAAAYFLLCYRDALSDKRPRRRWAFAALAGAAFGLALLNRISNVIVAPAILGYPVAVAAAHGWQRTQHPKPGPFLATLVRRHWRDALAFLVPLLALGLVVVAYNLARFGHPLRSGYLGLETRFGFPSLVAIYGMLFSPGKGFFLYSPILLAALLAIPAWFRRHRAEAGLALGVVILHVVFYSTYDTWAGRACWGPRHIVPMTPFMALFLAPALDRALRSRFLAAGLALLGAVSVGIQLVGTSVDFFPYLSWLGTLAPDAENTLGIFDPRYSPIVGNLSYITSATLDYAWAYAGGVAGQIDVLPPLLALVLALAAGLGAWIAVHRGIRTRTLALLSVAAGVAVTSLVAASLPRYYGDPRFGLREGERAVIAYLEAHARPGDALIATVGTHVGAFRNYNRARLPWYSLYREIPPDWTDKVTAVLQGAVSRQDRLWLLLNETSPGDPNSGVERWLAGQAYPVAQERFGEMRLCLYACPVAPISSTPAQPLNVYLGEAIVLTGYTLAEGPFQPGREVPVSLYWRAQAAVPADYTVFVQLLGPDGLPVTQIDSYPVAAFCPTSSWGLDETIRDNYGLPLPADVPPGSYRLIAGMYDLSTMQRLPVTPSGQDFVPLAEIQVVP